MGVYAEARSLTAVDADCADEGTRGCAGNRLSSASVFDWNRRSPETTEALVGLLRDLCFVLYALFLLTPIWQQVLACAGG